MPIAVGDILRITAVMQFDGLDDIVNVYHVKVDTNATANDDQFMDEMADAMNDLYTTINIALSELVTYIEVQGQNITQNELLPSKPWPTLVAGLSTSTPLPSQVSACVFHRTLRPKTRASKFLPVMTEGQNDGNGKIGAGTITVLQAFADALTSGFAGSQSFSFYGAYNAGLDRFTDVVLGIVPVRWRTQRRRRLGVGS